MGELAFPKSLAAGMLPSDSRSQIGCPMEAGLEGSPVREQALRTQLWGGGRGSSSLRRERQAGLLGLGGWFHPEPVAVGVWAPHGSAGCLIILNKHCFLMEIAAVGSAFIINCNLQGGN